MFLHGGVGKPSDPCMPTFSDVAERVRYLEPIDPWQVYCWLPEISLILAFRPTGLADYFCDRLQQAQKNHRRGPQ